MREKRHRPLSISKSVANAERALFRLFVAGLALPLAGNETRSSAEKAFVSHLPEIWIKGGTHLVNIPEAMRGVREDMGDMWTFNAPWQTVAARVKVAEFAPRHIQGASDKELKAVFDDMKRRNIALALETGLLTRSVDCQARNEAFAAPGEFKRMLEKIQRNGGELRYIAMDEPYYFGHKDNSGCHQSTTELANKVAQSVMIARQIYPNIEIGDIEVVGPSRSWIKELLAWADAYRVATGEKLTFMQTDVDWTELAMRNLRLVSEGLRAQGIPLAIIYNADANAKNDQAWERSAESHIAEIEEVLKIRPDIAVFDSWMPHPRSALPEDAPGTLTNLALHYLRPAPALSLTHRGTLVEGRLADVQGHPVVSAQIRLTAVDTSASMQPTIRTVSGVTPESATGAVIGLRIDSEGACVCEKDAVAVLGNIRYAENETGKQEIVSPLTPQRRWEPAGHFVKVKLVPGQAMEINLKEFPVTANAPYTFFASIAATASAEHAGYASLIFLDKARKGIKRDFLWFTPSRRDLGSAATDSDGHFALTLPDDIALGQPEIWAAFAGNTTLRAALAILPQEQP